MQQALPCLGLTVGLGLLATAGVESVISVPVIPQIGTVPAVQTPATVDLTSQLPLRPETPALLGPTALTGPIPRHLALPSLQVNAPIVPVGLQPGGDLTVPDDPHVLGWWQGGARPGSRQGSVVIDGHVDTAAHGPGALFSLRQLRPGDPVVLSTTHGSSHYLHYLIVAVRSYPKATLPAEVFTSTGPPRVVIITCGGAFDPTTRQYADNIIAYALPAPTDLPGHS
jgi:hypothetical protein